MTENGSLTRGLDHLGLAVRSLSKSVAFFVDGLGWTEKGGKPDYPAVFVGNGQLRLTLWQVKDPAAATPLGCSSKCSDHAGLGLSGASIEAQPV